MMRKLLSNIRRMKIEKKPPIDYLCGKKFFFDIEKK